MIRSTTFRSTAAGLVLATAWLSFVAKRDPLLDKASTFVRQPAATTQAENDSVWRLGRKLFFDASLSASGKTACSSCHDPAHGWSGSAPRAVGDGGKTLAFRAPTLTDTASLGRLGWTGRFADLTAVSFFAMSSPGNMNAPVDAQVARLKADPAYRQAFADAFGADRLDKETLGLAFSRFVGSITGGPTAFDRWATGETDAIGPEAKRGFALFTGKARCASCHSGPDFTDGSFHDIGTAREELGRGALFKTSLMLQHAFKAPGLRGVAQRGPYMHDGSAATLEDVIAHYDRGGIERPSRAEGIRPLHLDEEEKADLVAFLKSLSGDTVFTVAKPAS